MILRNELPFLVEAPNTRLYRSGSFYNDVFVCHVLVENIKIIEQFENLIP